MRNAIIAGLVALAAQGRWKEIGKTNTGNIVYIDSKSVKTKEGIITANVQVKFITPVKTPKGDWKLSRHVAMFDCAKKTVAAKSSTYYADEGATKVVERSVIAQPGFGTTFKGSMTQIALDYLCQNAK
jgi:hypothetical protein